MNWLENIIEFEKVKQWDSLLESSIYDYILV